MKKNICGIYKFTSKTSNKSYIGQSVDILKRYNEHKNQAFNKKVHHYSCHFYRAIRKYGFTDFIFEILEECSKKQLNEREMYWIQHYDTFHNGYNMTKGGEDNPSNNEEIVKKRTHTLLYNKEVNEKLKSYGSRKVTDEQVKEIRTAFAEGKRFKDVYPLYSNVLTRSGVQLIWLGKTFPDIMPEVYEQRNPSLQKGGCLIEDGLKFYQMRLDRMTGMKVIDIAKKYNINKKYLSDVLSLHHWKNEQFIPEGYMKWIYNNTKAKLDDDIMYRLSAVSVAE